MWDWKNMFYPRISTKEQNMDKEKLHSFIPIEMRLSHLLRDEKFKKSTLKIID